jgi:hypothetical protein
VNLIGVREDFGAFPSCDLFEIKRQGNGRQAIVIRACSHAADDIPPDLALLENVEGDARRLETRPSVA